MGSIARRTMHLATAAALVVAWLGLAGAAGAQATGTLQGTVRDASTLRPLMNVQVHIEGTTRGALTNAEGRYTILSVPAGAHQVRFQRIGHNPVNRAVNVGSGEAVRLDAELSPSAIALDEIVVSGAGVATERRKLGNTIATLDVSEIQRTAPVLNLSEVLQAREPGVVGLPSSGATGEGARIRIRGLASVMQSNEPVVYIDGVRVDASGGFAGGISAGGGGSPSRLDDINPESIERIEILKGAAAATLFGTQASNGVIQIFTKQGRTHEPRWDLRIEQGFSRYPNVYPSHAGFVTGQTASARDVGVAGVRERWGLSVQPYEVFEVDIVPDIWETGRHQTYSLSVTGGMPTVTYYVGGRVQMEDGPFGGKQFIEPGFKGASDVNDRRQITANLSLLPHDRLTVRANSSYTESHFETPDNSNNIFGAFSAMLMSRPEKAAPGNEYGQAAFVTVRETLHRRTVQDVQRFGGSLSAAYSITPELKLDAVLGIDIVNGRAERFFPFGWNVDAFAGADTRGARQVGDRNRRELTIENKATWNAAAGPWTSALVVGMQGFVTQTKSSWGFGGDFPGPGLEVAGAGAVQQVWEGFLEEVNAGAMAQEQIGYGDYLFLTLGARYDKHSAFGETAGGAFYPKASLSWVPSDMSFWSSDRLSTLRLRTAIGRSGLQPSAFAKYTTFTPLAAETGPGVAPLNLGNPDIKPETSTEWELGAEFGVLNDRASFEVTYWNRTVKDLLVDRQFPPSGGFRSPQLDNIGEMKGKGVELGTRAFLTNSPRFSLSVFANASYIFEQVTDMGEAPPLKAGGQYQRYRNFVREGFAPGAFFGPILNTQARYPISIGGSCNEMSEAQLLEYLSVPRAPDLINPLVIGCGGDILNNYIGKPTPDWQGAFGTTMNFLRNFQLNSLFEYRAGNYHVHDMTSGFRQFHPLIGRNLRGAAEIEATLMNPASTPQQRLAAADRWVREFRALSPFDGLNEIHKADWVRLRELSLTYTLPPELAGRFRASTMSITAAGRNLALWTRYPGPDPEENAHGRGGGTDYFSILEENIQDGTAAFALPVPRRFTLSLNLGF